MKKTGNILMWVMFLLLLPCWIPQALASVSVQSTVDRNEMGMGDTFTVTVVVSSNESVNVQDPRAPELDGFDLINKWDQTAVSQKLVNTSKGMQFETQRRREFNYMLSPTRMGNLSVSSFEVVVDGKVYRTQPIVIQVTQNAPTGSAQGHNGRRQQARPKNPAMPPGFDNDDMDQAEEELFNQLLQQRQQLMQQFGGAVNGGAAGGNGQEEDNSGGAAGTMKNPAFRSLPTNPNEAFFIQVEVDKTDVYEGEQITANWYIYTRGQMETLDRLKFPDLRGFWKEIIEEVPTIQFTEEIVNGIPYKKALLASHALFPIKAGTAYIDEYKIKSRVRVPVNGFGGFFGRAYEFTKSSQKVKINVKPLPLEGRPSDFTGAVGQFEVNTSVEGDKFPVNQPFSLKVRFEGAGNAKLIDLPPLNLPPGIEVYDTKSESKFFKNGRSYKEFEVLLIPRQEGEITIPALSTSFFDPRAKKYYTKSSQPLKVTIVANPNAPVGASSRIGSGPAPTPPALSGHVLPEILQTWEKPLGFSVAQKPLVWGGIYFLVLLSLVWKAQSEIGFGQRRKSLKDLVQRRMKKIDAALANQDFRKVGAEMTNIFYLVLGETVGEGGSGQEISKLLEKAPPSLRRDYAADIMKYFEIFQTLSFAPEEMLGALKDSSQLKNNVEAAKKLIHRVISVNVENVDEKN